METYLYIGVATIVVFISHLIFQEKYLQHRLFEIPIANHLVPWIGSPLRYATIGPRAFLMECSRKLGPIFSFNVFGHRIIMISSLNALREVFKLERNGSFAVISGQQMHTMNGYRATQQRYDYIYISLRQKAFRHLYQAFSAQEIVRRAPDINSIIQENIHTALRDSGNYRVSVTSFTRRMVHQTILGFFFGPDMPDIFEDNDALDIAMPMIMYGLENFVPSAVRRRERVYSTIAKHLSDKCISQGDSDGHLEGASDFMTQIIQDMNNDGFTPEEKARYTIAILWGATSNVMLVCTWVMGQMISNTDLHSKITNEARLATNDLNPDELLEMSQKEHCFPYLDALIQEVLRTKTQVPLMRVAQEDVVILDEGRELHIRKGDLVAPDAPTLNMTPAYFHEPQNFNPERFIDSSESKALYVFGGGLHSCAGRHLALHVIRMVVILTFYSFDINLNATSDKVLRENINSFSSFVRMSNDLFIDILPRNDKTHLAV